MNDVLTLQFNDAAVRVLRVAFGLQSTAPSGGLTVGLQQRLDRGIIRRGAVLTWADSVGEADRTPSVFNDLTAWECADSSLHLEDFVPVNVDAVDDAPLISDSDQRILLSHGLAFALEFSRQVYALDPPCPVRCIVGANDTNATFRFHQIRQGEHWKRPIWIRIDRTR